MIEPLNDLVLIERIDEQPQGTIVIPDSAQSKSMKGKVVAVGPGKWMPGTWHKLGSSWMADRNGIQVASGGNWEWIEGYRRPIPYKPGQIVYFNSKWNEFSGSHFSGEEPIHIDKNLHLIFEADIFMEANNGRA